MLDQFLAKLRSDPTSIQFKDTIELIEALYTYTPTDFSNGEIKNTAGTNEGSCKIFSFAKLNTLPEDQTLHCFGDYYREDVLKHPDGNDHGNIRNFMETGWEGVQFASDALTLKNP